MIASHDAWAAWSLEPSYYVRAERSDNIYLAQEDASNHTAVTGGAFSPALKVKMEEENQTLVADLDVQFTRYKDHDELDRDEGKAAINWKRGTELSVYGVDVSYTNKTNLDSTIDAAGIDQVVEIKTANIAPNWQYQFAENWNVALSLSYTDVEYDEPGYSGVLGLKVVNFINYEEQAANLSVANQFTEKDNLSFAYYQSRYEGLSNGLQFSQYVPIGFVVFIEASERRLEYDYQVVQLNYSHQFDPTQSVVITYGSSETDINNYVLDYLFDQAGNLIQTGQVEPTNSQQKGKVYNLSYTHKSEISRLELSAGRNRVAVSTGGLEETDTAKIYYNSKITERFSWALDINGAKYRPDADTNVQASQDYTRINARPSLYYSLDKDWSLSLGYQYSKKDIETEDSARESNLVFFTMSWRDPKLLSTN